MQSDANNTHYFKKKMLSTNCFFLLIYRPTLLPVEVSLKVTILQVYIVSSSCYSPYILPGSLLISFCWHPQGKGGGGGYQEEYKELHELPKQINCKIFIRLTFGQEGRSPRGIYHEKYSPHSIPVIVYY